MQNKTVIIIAHRLSTIRNADKIIVMEKGHLVEEGKHNELVAAGGRYSQMWNHYTEAVDRKGGVIKMKKLKEFLFLSDKGYKDLKKAIVACTITNLALMLPFCVTVMLFSELLNPYVGKQIAWNHIWLLWGIGVVSAVLVFLAARNDYKKTYIASYQESNKTRLNIAEYLRKLPMSFFNTKDLSELTTNMMSDCSSMESMLSSTIPPLIANGITVTLTCILLAFFDWRLALCMYITLPVAFLIIWLSKNYQKKLFLLEQCC